MNKTVSSTGIKIISRFSQNSYYAYFIRSISTQKIKIPIRVKRGPTDILKAIASTVKIDSTGAAYKFQDDPFLSPIVHWQKRRCALSKEAGKKAARWIRDNNGEIFNFQADDPIIQQFLPKVTYENKDVNETTIKEAISNVQVSEAIEMYNICKENNREISEETLQSLLEFLCYFNSEDTIDADWIEDFLYKDPKPIKIYNSWAKIGVVEEIFNKLKENGSKPYCAIINGMCRYFEKDEASKYFLEATSNNIPLDTSTYNAMINLSPLQGDESLVNWEFTMKILSLMKEKNIKPNTGTLNSILGVLNRMRSWRKTDNLSLSVMKEFDSLGVEPSLASYYYLIMIHSRGKNNCSIISSVVDRIEGKSFSIKDPNDTKFFVTAMTKSEQDFNLSQRIHDTLLIENNFMLLGESVNEIRYYRNYLLSAVKKLPYDEFLKIYDYLTPYIYTTETPVLEKMLVSCEFDGNAKEIPRIWSEIITFDFVKQEHLIDLFLMVTNKMELESLDEQLKEKILMAIDDLYDRLSPVKLKNEMENAKRKMRMFEWSGEMLGECISILNRLKNATGGLKILIDYKSLKNTTHLGRIPPSVLMDLFKSFQKIQKEQQCLTILDFAKENGYSNGEEMAKQMLAELNTTEETRKKLVFMFGTKITDQQQKEKDEQ